MTSACCAGRFRALDHAIAVPRPQEMRLHANGGLAGRCFVSILGIGQEPARDRLPIVIARQVDFGLRLRALAVCP